ncbi:transposase [Streptomyces sp. V4I8]
MIADQARMRRDLQPIRPSEDASIELRLLTERRVDLVADRTRTTNRLKALLTSMFPALERTLDMGTTGALLLLSRVAEGSLTPRLSQNGA